MSGENQKQWVSLTCHQIENTSECSKQKNFMWFGVLSCDRWFMGVILSLFICPLSAPLKGRDHHSNQWLAGDWLMDTWTEKEGLQTWLPPLEMYNVIVLCQQHICNSSFRSTQLLLMIKSLMDAFTCPRSKSTGHRGFSGSVSVWLNLEIRVSPRQQGLRMCRSCMLLFLASKTNRTNRRLFTYVGFTE